MDVSRDRIRHFKMFVDVLSGQKSKKENSKISTFSRYFIFFRKRTKKMKRLDEVKNKGKNVFFETYFLMYEKSIQSLKNFFIQYLKFALHFLVYIIIDFGRKMWPIYFGVLINLKWVSEDAHYVSNVYKKRCIWVRYFSKFSKMPSLC